MAEIKRVNSIVVGTRISLGCILPDNQFFLMKITENKEFVDGTYTDKVIGLTFELVELHDFKRIKVKIDGLKKTFITNEELEKIKQSGEHVMVRLEQPTILAYINTNTSSIEDSIKAEGIERVVLE